MINLKVSQVLMCDDAQCTNKGPTKTEIQTKPAFYTWNFEYYYIYLNRSESNDKR